MKKLACALCALLASSAALAPTASASALPDVYETTFASAADLVALSRFISEDPDAPQCSVRMDANLDGIVNIEDVAIYQRHMALYPLIQSLNADIEHEWIEVSECFGMEHENETITATLTVSSGQGYGTALDAEPYFNAWAYEGDYASGTIVLLLESDTDYMEYVVGTALEYCGEVFAE